MPAEEGFGALVEGPYIKGDLSDIPARLLPGAPHREGHRRCRVLEDLVGHSAHHRGRRGKPGHHLLRAWRRLLPAGRVSRTGSLRAIGEPRRAPPASPRL